MKNLHAFSSRRISRVEPAMCSPKIHVDRFGRSTVEGSSAKLKNIQMNTGQRAPDPLVLPSALVCISVEWWVNTGKYHRYWQVIKPLSVLMPFDCWNKSLILLNFFVNELKCVFIGALWLKKYSDPLQYQLVSGSNDALNVHLCIRRAYTIYTFHGLLSKGWMWKKTRRKIARC